ncbi:class I SAM-dependent methyltransferase [Puniceicoccaceae bacterium K14]|nr:class I SAM-dependent methyltransferase [Puniceicoccaceae bacterium K14]
MTFRSFDTIAPSYSFFEKFVFGNALQKARSFGLKSINREITRALLVGDGNGRFAVKLMKAFPNCQVVSVDSSPRMLELSIIRINKEPAVNPANFTSITQDIRGIEFPENDFDFIGLHFILDCFSTKDCNALLRSANGWLNPLGFLSYADFEIPPKQPMRFISRSFIAFLYAAFKVTSNTQTRNLPEIEWPPNLVMNSQYNQIGGMLCSKLFVGPQLPERSKP